MVAPAKIFVRNSKKATLLDGPGKRAQQNKKIG